MFVSGVKENWKTRWWCLATRENKIKLKINAYDHKIIHSHLQNILFINII